MINKRALKALTFLLIIFTLSGVLQAQVQELEYAAGPANTTVINQADKKILPCQWRKKSYQAHLTELDSTEFIRTFLATQNALNKYPVPVIQENLQVIYLLKDIRFHGVEYGATYHKKKIYIANKGLKNGYTDEFIEGRFHHEFSSILLKRHSSTLDKSEWLKTNPEDFEYGEGGRAALYTANAILAMDSSLFTHGFLNQYSLASIEEDFNCYAEFLFLSEKDFWFAYDNNAAIREKTRLIINFYHSIDPEFTLEYFRNL